MSLTIPDFSSVKALVVGDVMLDEYWFGPTSRISPEAPVPVVRVSQSQARAGGAANVAINLASLGAQTTVVGIVGRDERAETLRKVLLAKDVAAALVESATCPTITKLRVLSRNQQLIRLDTEELFPAAEASPVMRTVDRLIAGADTCVLSDYGKGTLTDVQAMIALCRRHGVATLVDPKGDEFSRYRGATALTPNLAEFEAVVGTVADDDELVRRGQALRRDLELDALLVTLSERGMVVIGGSAGPVFLPARAREVFDVTGAGDTVVAALAAGLGTGLGIVDAAMLANLAAGLVVRKIGSAFVTPMELRQALHEHGQGGRAILRREEAQSVAAEARARGERIVMTNGCFDILHAGHVAYLEEAKTRGDRLVVAVNDDDSVRRLKGAGRPINSLEDRMAVLAGLAAVDWVVPFHEDTPERLVGEVLPDVLVKGGDYRPEDIAGGPAVLANGGTVEVLSFKAGRSTSRLLEAIRKTT
jgi:D-beta-D-heptose 7-phosphate kinase/D-beta-D-heptose 1-phosphate adenosyltransferase